MKGEIAVRYTIRHFDLPLLTFEANIHERKILTDQQLFSLKLLCLRCGQNFIIDQLIGLIKGFDHLGRFRMEIDFI